MLDTHPAIALDINCPTEDRKAATAAAKAKRLWPDVIGEVLAGEVMALLDLPLWLRSQTRTHRLIDAILSLPEAREKASRDGPPTGISGEAGFPSPAPRSPMSTSAP
jgi:hypothetical protein